MKILSIFGTRPEAIKLAPIIKKMKYKVDNFPAITIRPFLVYGPNQKKIDLSHL